MLAEPDAEQHFRLVATEVADRHSASTAVAHLEQVVAM